MVQVKPLLRAKKEYFALIDAIEKGAVTEAPLPKAELWGITIIELGAGLPIKYPYFKPKK